MPDWEDLRKKRQIEVERQLRVRRLLEAAGVLKQAKEAHSAAEADLERLQAPETTKERYKRNLSETRKLIRSLGPEVRRLPYDWKMYVKSLGNAAWTSPSKIDAFLETLRLAQTGVEMTEEQTKHAYELRFGNL